MSMRSVKLKPICPEDKSFDPKTCLLRNFQLRKSSKYCQTCYLRKFSLQ